MGGWAATFIYIRVPLNGMCKFFVSKIKNNVFNASARIFMWIKKSCACVKYVKFMEEYVKNNKQYIYIPTYLIPNLNYLSHRIKSYVVYIVIV